MITIRSEEKEFFSVSSSDAYLFYNLFNYKIDKENCFFGKNKLKKILKKLEYKGLNYKVLDRDNNILFEDNKHLDEDYDILVKYGKEKYLFNSRLRLLNEKLSFYIGKKDFNKIYKKLRKLNDGGG